MEESEKEIPTEKVFLDPDHPLLQKFQAALKEHLLSQINRMKDEIFEYETEAKRKNEERESLGVQTYEAQQRVCNQQKTLENVITELQTVTAAKEQVDAELEEYKQKHKELTEKLLESEKTERELQRELESVNYLIQQMSQWEKKIESHISLNRRIAEKSKKDMIKQGQEKRQQDILIYKLLNEIWKLESELESLDSQIKVKETEMEELEQSAAVGNTNIEALQSEYRCLMHAWHSVVVAISSRDKSLDCINEELSKLKEKFKSTIAETEQVKKLIKKELQENERFTLLKNRVEYEVKNSAQQIEDQNNKRAALESGIYELQNIYSQTENNIAETTTENANTEATMASISKTYEKVSMEKIELEEKIMSLLQGQMSNDKVATNMTKLLAQTKAKRRDVEVIMKEAQNKSSLIASETESEKFMYDENTRLLEEIKKHQKELETEVDFLQGEIDKYQLLFRKRERQVEMLNSKWEKVSGKNEEVVSPQELKILELEKHIEETQAAIKQLQSFWLREQKNLLNVSKERQEQIHDINMLKKQTLILEQKNIKINDDIEAYKKNEEKVMHNINNLQNKTSALCERLFKKKGQKEVLSKTNILLQSQYETKLKDAELSILNIEAEIAEIEEEKVTLSRTLLDTNREVLEWDKKLQLAREAVGSMKEERAKGGEVSTMKKEIHKMEVIYGQMKKAQEKLMKDLEHCISRRDTIFVTSEARSKKANEDKTRISYGRKMDNVRNKIKQVDNEIKKIQKQCKDLDDQKLAIEKDISDAEKEALSLKEYASSLQEELEQTKTNRQFNFELLVARQRKLTMYEDIAKKRTPYTIYRKRDQLVMEHYKAKDLNSKIGQVVDNLLSDFPNRDHELTRINNTLKIGALSIRNFMLQFE